MQDVKDYINATLAKLNMGFIKIDTPGGTRVIERVKALKGGSKGPLTVTNAHIDHCREVQMRVLKNMADLAAQLGSDSDYSSAITSNVGNGLMDFQFMFKLNNKTARVLTFTWRLESTYDRSCNLDPSYKTYWFSLQTGNAKIQ